MRQLQDEIGAWADATFGAEPRSAKRTAGKWAEESMELLSALQGNGPRERIHDELADCAILLFNMASREGVDLEQLVRAKFEVVRNRDQVQRDIDRGLKPAVRSTNG